MNTSDSMERRSVLERALRAVEDMQARLDALQREKREPIAIIGMGCRFPGQAISPEAYWGLLRDGVDAIRDVPADRWNIEDFYDPDADRPGKMYTRKGGFIDDVDKFDAGFFGISPRETLKTDPQQRLVLEVSWEALENAAIAPKDLLGSQTGVFVGITNNDYARIVERAGIEGIDAYHLTGNFLNFAAGRISYVLGLNGPAMAVDTACSTSGVTIHLACQSLRNRECDLALAGGVNLILSPEISITSTKARTLSPDGYCRTFDASANGYVRGEGCGVVVLKRLSDALANGDNILAVIRGSAVNQDGATSGITVPNKLAQAEVMRQALERAGIEPHQVDYIEAHGTGTPLGDPIEVRALASVYSKGRPAGQPLIIGTAKTNVGHLESAAGVAGLIKVVLSLQNGTIPRHLHFTKLNPAITLDDIPALIPVETRPWPRTNRPRIAGLSFFGGSGTISHMIVEEAPKVHPVPQANVRSAQLFCLSAKDPVALNELAGRYEGVLATAAPALADLCYTADSGRSHFNQRLAIVSSTQEELQERLHAYRDGLESAGLFSGDVACRQTPKLAFLFTGQGGQYLNMGRHLYEGEPLFRQTIDRCDELVRPHLPRSLRSVLYPQTGEMTPLDETQYTHVAMFAVQYGLAELWRSWGVEPQAVMGHSVGEIVAATVAGAMSLEDGLMIMRERGRLMQSLPPTGLMASLLMDEVEAVKAIEPYRERVSIAAINGPESTVISGERGAVQEILCNLEAQGIKVKPLKVSNSFHSPLVDPVLQEFEHAAARASFRAPRIAQFSSMRLGWVGDDNLLDAAYWRYNLRNTVRFAESMGKLYEDGYRLFVEIGPSPILVSMGSQCVPIGEGIWLPSLREDRDDWQQLIESLGLLYVNGVDVNWQGFYAERRARKVALPTYPFQRERYWVDAPPSSQRVGSHSAQVCETGHPLLGARLRSALPVFEQQLSTAKPAFLKEHRVFGKAVLPATAYLELALAAGEELFPGKQCVARNVVFAQALVLPDDEERTIQITLTDTQPTSATFKIFSLESKGDDPRSAWVLHATGDISIEKDESGRDTQQEILDAAALMERRCSRQVNILSYYDSLRARGLEFGPGFQGLDGLWDQKAEALARIKVPESLLSETAHYHVHPAVLDACLQPIVAALSGSPVADSDSHTYLPQRLESFRVFRCPDSLMWSRVSVRQTPTSVAGEVAADIDVFDSERQKIAEVRGLVLRRAGREAIVAFGQEGFSHWLYQLQWEEAHRVAETRGPVTCGTWLVMADDTGAGAALAATLESRGEQCTVVSAGKQFRKYNETRFELDGTCPEHFEHLLRELSETTLRGVVYLWPLNAVQGSSQDWTILKRGIQQGCGSLLHLVKALVGGARAKTTKLCIVTRGAQPIACESDLDSLPQFPVAALGGTIDLEYPELHCTRIDLDPRLPVTDIGALLREIRNADDEEEHLVAFRGGGRFVARLVRTTPSSRDARNSNNIDVRQPYQLTTSSAGILEGLSLSPVKRRLPGPGEVEIEVHATGVGFRDVLMALGRYPGPSNVFGYECSGEVVQLGEGVEQFQLGQKVLAVGPGSFSSFVTIAAERVLPIPAPFSEREAATLPSAFLTAQYALCHLGKISAGETVLIHAAAGGVGLAALQLAQRAGAEIFATAGTTAKRAYLKSLGVTRVMDSRTLDFADQVMAATGGRGVDLVLNSLAGDFIAKSLSVTAIGGRFLEIGRTGVWDEAQVAQLDRNISYFRIDLSERFERHPGLIRRLFNELLPAFNDCTLKPLPLKVFPITQVISAFRFMAQARHVGKIVVSHPTLAGKREAGKAIASGEQESLKPDASYLITGGLAGLGLLVARSMVERGAKHLVLTARSAVSETASAVIRDMEAKGAEVVVDHGDVSDRAQLLDLFARFGRTLPPLRGIVHAAGTLDDGVLTQQSWERFEKVMAPKVDGSWHLHELSQDMPLDFFVLFSSAVSVLGSAGQGNHVAACGFQDALTHHRHGLGLPSTSINWGPWGEVGAATQGTVTQRLQVKGFQPIEPRVGMRILEHLLRQGFPQVGVMSVDWQQFVEALPPGHKPTLFTKVLAKADAPTGRRKVQPLAGLIEQLKNSPSNKRRQVLETHIREQAIKVLGLSSSDKFDPHRGLATFGMDSLMTIELKNRLQASVGKPLSSTIVFDHPTVAELAEYLEQNVLFVAEHSQAKGVGKNGDQAKITTDLKQLSDVEAEAVLAKELAGSA